MGRRATRVGILLLVLSGCAAPATPSSLPPGTPSVVPQSVRPRREPPLKVSALLDRDPATVEAALGPPVLRRPEGAGEAWLYAHPTGCSIDLVLFTGKSGTRVSHATTRTPPDMSEAACLRLIADQ